MNKSLLVAVFVPIKDAAGEEYGEVATGYPVGKDLILTARHVLQPKPPACRDKGRPIKILWHHYNSRWIDIPDENVWQSQGKLDAALIRCPRPLEAVGWGIISDRKPDDDVRWHSAGFPRATKYDNVRKPSGFGGWVRSMADQDDCFELIEDAQPDSDENWKGASGMPVFVGGSILGVVQSVPPKFNAKKLYATPTWKLLEDAAFKKALGWDDQDERLERARKSLSSLLERSDEVTRELAVKLKLSSREMPTCRKEVVEKLLTETPPLEELFEQALSVQEVLLGKKDRDGARVAAELMLSILPAIHDAGVVSDVRRRKGDVTEPVIALPTELRTLAEIIMAGADHREALLRPVQAEGYFPDGEPSLAPPPESGRDKDADGKQFSRDVFTHLVTVFGNDCKRFDRDFRNYLKERFIQRNQRSSTEESLCEAIAGELRYLAEKKHLTYYFIAEISADPSVRQVQEEVLAELKQDFRPIAFLRLAGGEGLAKERERYRPLCDLLYQNPEAGG